MRKTLWILALSLAILSPAIAYKIESIYPDAGPMIGDTKVNIYTPEFKGLNYTDFPHPKCQFGPNGPVLASWVHCSAGYKANRSETCLTCMSNPHNVNETVKLRVSLTGDFKDALEWPFIYYVQPEVHYSVPFIGKRSGGTKLQVFGANFQDFGSNLKCAFGTVYVPAKFVSTRLVTCESPPSDVVDAAIPLKVTQNLQQATETYIAYYYYTLPEISQLIPDRGPNTGGTNVIIKGKMLHPFKNSVLDFYNTTFVSFGKDNLIKVNLINNTHASVISPPAALEGQIPVEITFNNQEWSQDGIMFFYYTPPFVFQLGPGFGTIQGGTNITVIGANFQNSTEIKCKFGNKVVPGKFIDSSHIYCISPPTDKSGYVDFGLALYGDNYSGDGIKYLYLETPIVDNIYPLCGPTEGLTQLTFEGKHFTYVGPNMSYCIFNKTIYEPVTILNENLLYCDTPRVLDRNGINVYNVSEYPIDLTINLADTVATNFSFHYYDQPTVQSIYPFHGSVSGGTQVLISGNLIFPSCNLTARFGTYQVPATLTKDGRVNVTSPEVTCPGQTPIQISPNGQQYTTRYPETDIRIFTFYEDPIVSYTKPDAFPSSGDSYISLYGSGFLFSRNNSLNDDGSDRIKYKVRYINATDGKVLGQVDADKVTKNRIDAKTIPVKGPIDRVIVEISPDDGQRWFRSEKDISYYKAPSVISIDPQFGLIKQRGQLTATGVNFDCKDEDCPHLRCSFSTEDFNILTLGTRLSSTKVLCDIPSMSRPDVTKFRLTFNGLDFTTEDLTYTFYDALVYKLDPSLIPLEGGTVVGIKGYGYANTTQLKAKLQLGGVDLTCKNGSCVYPASYINANHLTFVCPPENIVKDPQGNEIGFTPFAVEVSIYGDSFTNNNIKLMYYEQPEVGQITPDGSAHQIHSGSAQIIHVPIKLKFPPTIDPEEFIRRLNTTCRYQVGKDVIEVQGTFINYPFPKVYDPKANAAIDCPVSTFPSTGTGTIGIALNGQNYVGNRPVEVLPQLNVKSITPQCGPKKGGTPVKLGTVGFTKADLSKLFFSWSTVCTPLLTKDLFIDDTTVSTKAPAVQYADTSNGGTALVVFSVEKSDKKVDGTVNSRIYQHYESGYEFLYYENPRLINIYPHSGDYRGGTPVLVEGANFFSDLRHQCTPKCRFGDQLVEAEIISSVLLRCLAPAGKGGLGVSFSVTMNGIEDIPSNNPQTFTFLAPPFISSISPKSGPSTGGTLVVVTGANFSDMSLYPKEFSCVFKSVSLGSEVKRTPAKFVNSTTVLCTTAGGWGAGHMATIELSYNTIETTNFGQLFRFYQIDRIWPRAGPSSGDKNNFITIYGTGFTSADQVACQIGGRTVQASSVNWTQIQCPIPPSNNGDDFFGKSDLLYSFNGGKDWIMVVDGFSYYRQPEVRKFSPPFVSTSGGVVRLSGDFIRGDFYGADVRCKVGQTAGKGVIDANGQLICNFPPISLTNSDKNNLLIALNGVSFTEPTDANLIYAYDVTGMSPRSGIVEGGTSVHIYGTGFPPGLTPICRFGVPGKSGISYGKIISSNEVLCGSPPADLPSYAAYPYEMPVSLTFDNVDYNIWSKAGQTFYYYIQPNLASIEPYSGLVDQTSVINVTSGTDIAFAPSIIGTDVTLNDKILNSKITCRFGKYGETRGVLISNKQISCPTPSLSYAVTDFTEDLVEFQVALNGEDFTPGLLTFKFVGSKSSAARGLAWIVAIVIGCGVLVFLVYLIINVSNNPNRHNE